MLGSSLQAMFGSLTPLAITDADLATILDVDPALAAGDGPSLLASAVRMVAALAVVLGLLLIGVYLLRRFGGRFANTEGPQGKGVQILHTRPLGGRRCLTVVHWEGRKILLGIAGESITALAQEPDAASLQDQERFDAELTEAFQRRRDPALPRIAGGAH